MNVSTRISAKVALLLLAIGMLFQAYSYAQNRQSTTSELSREQIAQPTDKYFEIAKNLDILATLFKEVNAYYVDEVNPNSLMKTGIDAMLKSLDPYTNYIPEDEIEDYRTMTTGQYGGIGALVGTREGRSIVLMPYEGYPAYEAGLQIGDEILSIDGIEIKGKASSDVSKLLKGQANTILTLTILRYGETTPRTVTLNRKNVKINNVPYYAMLNAEVGYIVLSDFTFGAANEVQTAFEQLKTQGAKKVVLDLRGNPGGLLNEAINICNLFIPRNADVVSTKGKIQEWNKIYKAQNNPIDTETPLIVLINGRSASASEIVSGVIQDYDRGVLIGQRSFGKGLVQTTRPLSYNSQLKVTTAKYYIPSGRCIQAIDYSTKDEDGKAGKFPDSLKKAFKTKVYGRTVYDGNGLDPDIILPAKSYTAIVNSLRSKNLIFEYACEYKLKHPALNADARTFALSDTEYQEFMAWLSNKEYDYTTEVEKSLLTLEENAKKEQYYDSIKDELNLLKESIAHDKNADLVTFRKDIQALLEVEIAARYFLTKGQTEAAFRHDEEIKSALSIFEDLNQYNKILQGN